MIVILTNTLKSGGAEKQSIYLFNALSGRYNALLIVYYGEQHDQRMLRLIDNNYKSNVIFLRGSHLARLRHIFKLLKSPENTVCISYLATTNLINAVVGRIAGVHVRIGGIRSSELPWFKKILQRHLHNNWLNHSVFNNYVGLKKLTKEGFVGTKSSVIHNAIDIGVLEVEKHSSLTILTVGRFVEAKDYFTSLSAIKALSLSVPFIQYLMVGHGVLEETIRTQVRVLQLEGNVEIVKNPDDINQYYRTSDIYLSTSLFEGLSNSIMEAMSFGLPVVATDVGDNQYLVKDRETGFLTGKKDADGIASKLLQLVKNKELRMAMGLKGRQHIMENFSIEKFTQQYQDLIEKLSHEA